MIDCKCKRSFNGYYQWKCSKRPCQSCKDAMPAKLKFQSSDYIITVNQFEVVTSEYLKYNKKTKEVETKTTKRKVIIYYDPSGHGKGLVNAGERTPFESCNNS